MSTLDIIISAWRRYISPISMANKLFFAVFVAPGILTVLWCAWVMVWALDGGV